MGRRGGPAPVHVPRVPDPARPADGAGEGGQAEGRGGRARPPAGGARGARRASWPTAPSAWRSGRRTTCSWAWPSRPAARRPPTPTSPAPARSPIRSPIRRSRKWTHDAKALERVTLRAGAVLDGVAFDTMLAGYLLDPGTADYPLAALSERYLGTDLFGADEEEAAESEGQLFAERPLAARGVRGRRRVAAGARPGRADRPPGPAAAPRGRGAAARLRPRADGGTRGPARRPVPRGDGRVRPRPDGHPPRRGVPARRAGVQPELAAAAPGDPLRPARPPTRQEDAEGRALHRRQRAREAPRRAPDRGRAPVVAGAGQAELHLPGGAAEARRREGRPAPHLVQPDRGGHREALVVQPEPPEHPDPLGARPADPPGVHPRRRRPGPARGRLLADRAPDPRAPLGRRRAP